MNKFHTSLSRRDFMKGLGLASAGIGAVAAVSPVFHDLDEVASADSSVNKRPWWVREVDKPTIEIDWDKMAALAIPTEGCHLPPLLAEFVGWDRVNTAMAQGQTALKEGAQKVGSREAISLLDTAIQEASWPHFLTQAGWREPVTPVLADPAPIPELVGSIMTHETLGVAKWEGTPEENFALLKSAMRFFGAGQIASIELDTNVKKMLYPQDASRMFFNGPIMSYKFEDVDKGYMTDTNYVIPNTARWIVTYTTPMPKEMYRTAPSGVCYAANMSRYRLNHETIDFLLKNRDIIRSFNIDFFSLGKGSAVSRLPEKYGVTRVIEDKKADEFKLSRSYETSGGLSQQEAREMSLSSWTELINNHPSRDIFKRLIVADLLPYVSHFPFIKDLLNAAGVSPQAEAKQDYPLSASGVPRLNKQVTAAVLNFDLLQIRQNISRTPGLIAVPQKTAVLYEPVKSRLISLTATELAILKLCDGQRDLRQITDKLSAKYNAPEDIIEKDCRQFLHLLREMQMVSF
ncbi:PqqD family peptide modification chaperone [Dehalococcoides sp. THU4]|uniref:PqqD family peptide modification chaperone n=1 Tax=Dehalococcoides sp. THU4 TaxID=3348344 RepID=UPI0037177546